MSDSSAASNAILGSIMRALLFVTAVTFVSPSVFAEKSNRKPSQDIDESVAKSMLRVVYQAEDASAPKLTVLKGLNGEITTIFKYRSTENAISFSCLPMTGGKWGCSNECQMGTIIVSFPKGNYSEVLIEPYSLRIRSCDVNNKGPTLTIGKTSATKLVRVRPY